MTIFFGGGCYDRFSNGQFSWQDEGTLAVFFILFSPYLLQSGAHLHRLFGGLMSASPMGGDPHPLVAITEARKQKEEALKNIFDMMKQSLSELGPTRESERALDEFQTRSKCACARAR